MKKKPWLVVMLLAAACTPSPQAQSVAAAPPGDLDASARDDAWIADCQMALASGYREPPPGCRLDRSDVPTADLTRATDAAAPEATPRRGTLKLSATQGDPVPAADRTLVALRPKLLACYRRALADTPTLAGEVTLSVRVAPNGEVSKATDTRHSGLPAAVVTCIARVLSSAIFDAPGGRGATLEIDARFSPD